MPNLTLTSIRLNLRHPAVQTETQDVCRMHARVLDATAGMPDGPRLLWAHPAWDLLVIRATEPITGDRLPSGYAAGITVREWRPPAHGRHRAVLMVNPVRQRSRPGPHRSGKQAITERDAQAEWVRGRLGTYMERLQVRLGDGFTAAGWHRDRHRVAHRLTRVEVEGIVTDPAGLAALAMDGVGRAKAYGGGLSIWEKL